MLKVVIIDFMSASSLFMMVKGANFPPITAWKVFNALGSFQLFEVELKSFVFWLTDAFSDEGGRSSPASRGHFQCLPLENFVFCLRAVQSLKKGKSAGVDIIPGELVHSGRGDVIPRSHGNLQQDLANRRMANPVDPVLSHHTSQEKQSAAVPELPNDQPHQPLKQSHAEDRTEQIEAKSGEDHR